VYVTLDEPYSRPVLEAFTRETGIKARPVYDTEANKSRGLAERLRAERSRPQADVFWSSEVLQTVRLSREGLFAPYQPSTAAGIPAQYRDPQDRWTGFAARFRVLAVHPSHADRPPKSLLELVGSQWRGQVAMANPLFGTTTTEAAALFQSLGRQQAESYYRQRQANETRVVAGNSVAAEQAMRGEVQVAQTDTDDAFVRQGDSAAGKRPKLKIVFPDQEPGGMGTLLIPNTAALVQNASRPEPARRFLDFLLRPETELLLAGLPARQLPLHPGLEDQLPAAVRPLAHLRPMTVDYPRLADEFEELDRFLREVFLQ
jgi:iron(III) transport system substrate-binding protein